MAALHALLAQLVEHLHGKEGVDGSSPSEGSLRHKNRPQMGGFLLPRSTPSSTSFTRRGSVFVEAASTGSAPVFKRTRGGHAPSQAFWGQVLGTESGVVLPPEATKIARTPRGRGESSRPALPVANTHDEDRACVAAAVVERSGLRKSERGPRAPGSLGARPSASDAAQLASRSSDSADRDPGSPV
jgi:hypothetical protein